MDPAVLQLLQLAAVIVTNVAGYAVVHGELKLLRAEMKQEHEAIKSRQSMLEARVTELEVVR